MFNRSELEIVALAVCPTEDIYELRDSIDGATDAALWQIIRENSHELGPSTDAHEAQMRDVMCIWESIVDETMAEHITDSECVYSQKREAVGASEMRDIVINTLLTPLQVGWDAVSDDYDEPFDVEFVPRFLAHATQYLGTPSNGWKLSEAHGVDIAQTILRDQHKIENIIDSHIRPVNELLYTVIDESDHTDGPEGTVVEQNLTLTNAEKLMTRISNEGGAPYFFGE